jgi:hypothetical protein
MESVFRRMLAVKYDGTNSDEVLEVVRDQSVTASIWSIKGEDETGLVLTESNEMGLGYDWNVPLEFWVVVAPDMGLKEIIDDDKFNSCYGSLDRTIAVATQDIIELVEALIAGQGLQKLT